MDPEIQGCSAHALAMATLKHFLNQQMFQVKAGQVHKHFFVRKVFQPFFVQKMFEGGHSCQGLIEIASHSCQNNAIIMPASCQTAQLPPHCPVAQSTQLLSYRIMPDCLTAHSTQF